MAHYNNRSYAILDTSELDGLDLSEVLVKNANELPKTKDGSKALVKYEGSQPSFLNGKTIYTHQEILQETSKEAWVLDAGI
tara:strand:+ start:155 stop:397 length:243 start_codon:yes stop_codon:yes gene_type:complete